jgi:acylphosphatase
LKLDPVGGEKPLLRDGGGRAKKAPMTTDPTPVRAHVTIHGRVQGVYFRASTVQEAQNLRLTGWVRNCPDGSVEAVVEGARNEVEDLIAWCRRGPRGARVQNVDVKWLVFSGEFQDFRIAR